jgi:pilus assembly protein CpaF
MYRLTLRHFFAPVADLLFDDEAVTEVLINGPDEVFVERRGRLERTARRFRDERALEIAARNLAEYVRRRLDDAQACLDARLPEPDRFRVNVVLPPAARNGICVSIRKFSRADRTINHFVSDGSLDPAAAEYLSLMVKTKRNVIVSGGTGAGKTTLLNALSAAIPDDQRVVVIEDSSELRLQKPHVVYLEAKPPDPKGRGGLTIRDLFVNSLRMRPDRIVVGEVRRGEALDLVQSMLSGHDGAMSTVHASSPPLALVRLETLCLLNDVDMPVYAARAQVASAVQVIVQIARFDDGPRRVTAVSEVGRLGPDERYRLRPLFRWDGMGSRGRLTGTGNPSRFATVVRQSEFAEEIRLTAPLFYRPTGRRHAKARADSMSR